MSLNQIIIDSNQIFFEVENEQIYLDASGTLKILPFTHQIVHNVPLIFRQTMLQMRHYKLQRKMIFLSITLCL